MAAEQAYKYTDKVQKHYMPVYGDPANKPGFVTGYEFVQGVFVFGAHSGILTEDKLTETTVEYLLSKEIDGVKQYEGCFEKISKKEKK